MQPRRMLRKWTRKAKALLDKSRDDRGMSVVAILSMAVIISIFLAALYDGILPVYRKVASLRYANSLRTANEAAIDYVLDNINTGDLALTMGVNSTITPSIPASVTNQGATSPTVSLSITNLGKDPGTTAPNCGPAPNCVLYDRNRTAQYNFMRMTAMARVGGARKILTVLLQPIPLPTVDPLYASFGAWGTTAVQFVGRAGIGAYNLPTVGGGDGVVDTPADLNKAWKNPYQFADIGSNGAGNQVVARNAHSAIVEAGHQFEFPTSAGQFNSAVNYTQNQFNAKAASGLTNIDIMGNIYSNANNDGFTVPGGYFPRSQTNNTGANQSAASVFGASNGMPQASTIFDPVPGQIGGSPPAATPSGYQNGSASQSYPIPDTWNQTSNQTAMNNINNGTWSPATDTLPNRNWGNMGSGSWNPATPTTGPLNPSNPYTGGMVNSNSGFTQPVIPPAPGAPPGTPNLGTVTVNGTLKIVNGAAPVTSINVAAGKTLSIPPGNYQMTQMNVGSNGQIQIDPGVSVPTNVYLNPPSTSGTVALNAANGSSINMTGANGVVSITNPGGDPDQMGFKDGGPTGFGQTPSIDMSVDPAHPVLEAPGTGSCKNLTFNTNSNCKLNFGGNTRAIVNAPNAEVNVGAQAVLSKAANFFGAIVGGVTTIISDYYNGQGAFLHYDLNLKRWGRDGAKGTLYHTDPWAFYQPPLNNNGPLVQYRAVTWQEI